MSRLGDASVLMASGQPDVLQDGAAESYKTKGSHVIQAQSWIDERLGPDTFATLAEGKGGGIDSSVLLPGLWCEAAPLVQVLEAVARRLGRSVEDITMEIARENALKDLTSIYRVFLRVAAPVRVMSFTPRLWSNYVAFGEAVAVRNDPEHYIGECTGIPPHLLEWSCGAWRGFVPAAIEVAGGKNVRGRILGTTPDDKGLRKLQCEVRYRL